MVLKWNQYHILNRIKNIANITMEYLSISLMNSLYRSSSSSMCLYIISISSSNPSGLPVFISLRALVTTSCIEVCDGAKFGIGCNVIGSKLDPHRLPATMEGWITFRLFLRIFTSSKKGHKYISSSHIYRHIFWTTFNEYIYRFLIYIPTFFVGASTGLAPQFPSAIILMLIFSFKLLQWVLQWEIACNGTAAETDNSNPDSVEL